MNKEESKEYANKIIDKLRDCEDNALSNFRAERERINGKQEGYQEAMSQARSIIVEVLRLYE